MKRKRAEEIFASRPGKIKFNLKKYAAKLRAHFLFSKDI
jgi:hypothetical protein